MWCPDEPVLSPKDPPLGTSLKTSPLNDPDSLKSQSALLHLYQGGSPHKDLSCCSAEIRAPHCNPSGISSSSNSRRKHPFHLSPAREPSPFWLKWLTESKKSHGMGEPQGWAVPDTSFQPERCPCSRGDEGQQLPLGWDAEEEVTGRSRGS